MTARNWPLGSSLSFLLLGILLLSLMLYALYTRSTAKTLRRGATENRRGDECTEARHKHQQCTGNHTGHRQRQKNVKRHAEQIDPCIS